eukprot:UN02332
MKRVPPMLFYQKTAKIDRPKPKPKLIQPKLSSFL